MPTDYAALADQARKSAPVDYAALAAQARGSGDTAQQPGFWDSFTKRVTSESPLNPANWGSMIKSAIESPFSDEHMAEAQHQANLLTGKEHPTPMTAGDWGEGAADVTNAALMALITAGIMKGSQWAATHAGALADTAAAATDPAVIRSAVKVIPKGPAMLDAVDKFQAAKAAFEAARKNGAEPTVIRQSPAWADIQPSPRTVPEFTPQAPAALPSGRIPGNGQPQPVPEAVMELARKGLLKRTAAMPAEAPAPTPAPPVTTPPVAAAPAPAPAPQPVLNIRDLAQMPAKQARAALIAQQLRDEMLKNGSITEGNLTPPEEPDPAALRDMMRGDAVRDLPAGAPKAIAKANYAGNQEPKTAAAVYEAAGRAEKATSLAQMFYDEGVTEDQIGKWKKADWEKAASDRGMKPFSKASQEEVLFRLRRLRAKDTATPQPPGGIQ